MSQSRMIALSRHPDEWYEVAKRLIDHEVVLPGSVVVVGQGHVTHFYKGNDPLTALVRSSCKRSLMHHSVTTIALRSSWSSLMITF